MKVSVFGLGYVGAVTGACLARDGISVVGVDANPDKVATCSRGQTPIGELGLGELMAEGVASGRLRATTDGGEAVVATDVSLVCVGTPSGADGGSDLSVVYRVCAEIGKAARAKGRPHVVVIRSTVLPGTTARCAAILREEATGVAISVAFCPEFLREGSAIRDYDAPPYVVIGTEDATAERAVREIFATVGAPVLVTEPAVAELLKFSANAWHATKIAFANEIGRLAKSVGVDGRAVMDILGQDRKLNASAAYLRPGFAYGGSCLPKDVRALLRLGQLGNIDLPLLQALPVSNRAQIDLAVRQVLATGKRRIGLLGLAFKADTDDLRESPSVELAEQLMGKGCDLKILDTAVREARLVGTNREFIEGRIPHLSRLLAASAEDLVAHAEAVVVTHGAAELRDVLALVGPDLPIVDLAGTLPLPVGRPAVGTAW